MARSLSRIINKAQKAAEQNPQVALYRREGFAKRVQEDRKHAIAAWYERGDIEVIEWVDAHYKTHEGKNIAWDDPFLRPFYRAIGNPWLEKIFVEKPAQCGMTEAFIAMTAFCLARVRIPVGFGFEERNKQQKMSGERIQPALDFCAPIQQLQAERKKFTARQDIDNRQSITVAGVTLNMYYAGTKESVKDQQNYQAPPQVRSMPLCINFSDEFGLQPPAIIQIIDARMARTELPTKMIRAGSTPSYEGSFADLKVQQAHYLFQWYCYCPHCHQAQFLDPFGNFLKEVELEEEGIKRKRYVSRTGRPLRWFHHSENPDGLEDWQIKGEALETAIESAYIGCKVCGEELPESDRFGGEFRDRYHDHSLEAFLDEVTRSQTKIFRPVGIRLPKLASYSFEPKERIRALIEGDKPEDEIQQGLGKPFTMGVGKITAAEILECRKIETPDRDPDLITMGIDQGQAFNYAVAVRWWLDASQKSKELQWQRAQCEVFWYGELSGWGAIASKAQELGASEVAIDSEPEFNSIASFALKYQPKNKGIARTLWNMHLPRADDTVRNTIESVGWLVEEEINDIHWLIKPRNRQAIPANELIAMMAHANIRIPPSPERIYPKSKDFSIYLIDQVDLKYQSYKRIEKPIQGVREDTKIAVNTIDRSYGLDCLRNRIYEGRVKFPENVVFNPKDKGNLVLHYTTIDRHTDGSWGKGDPDHYFHAHCFAEIVPLLAAYNPGVKRAGVTSIKMK